MTQMIMKQRNPEWSLASSLLDEGPIHMSSRPSKYGPIDFQFSQEVYIYGSLVHIHTIGFQENKPYLAT